MAPESTGKTQARGFWTERTWTRRAVLVAVALTALGTAVATFLLLMQSDIGDYFDSDRPPIIVNNGGSVIFRPALHLKGRGEWREPQVSTGKQWQHHHSNSAPTRIRVTTKRDAGCTDANGRPVSPPFVGTRVDVTFDSGSGSTETAALIVGVDYLTADFTAATAPTLNGTELGVHSGNAAVQIRSLVINGNTCTFAHKDAEIKVKQLK